MTHEHVIHYLPSVVVDMEKLYSLNQDIVGICVIEVGGVEVVAAVFHGVYQLFVQIVYVPVPQGWVVCVVF